MQRSKLLGSVMGATLAAFAMGSRPASAATDNHADLECRHSVWRLSCPLVRRSAAMILPAPSPFTGKHWPMTRKTPELRQSLLLVLLTDGQFKQALPIADELKAVPEIERFSRLALGIDALNRKQYQKVNTLMMLSLQSDLDRMITGLISAWAKAGAGKPNEALSMIDKLQGPEGFTSVQDL